MSGQIVIADRFRGPPGSANGGYTCGRLAEFVGGPTEVTLRSRPPLERAMQVEAEDASTLLLDGDSVVAEAHPVEMELETPSPVSFEEAEAVSLPVPVDEHPFPECFVCGPTRTPGDGLCVYPSEIEGSRMVASTWIPDASLARAGDVVADEFMWAALDCPSGFAAALLEPQSGIILGRMHARLVDQVRVGDRLVVVGWPLEKSGRKLSAGSAILSEDGGLMGLARTIWIELRPAG